MAWSRTYLQVRSAFTDVVAGALLDVVVTLGSFATTQLGLRDGAELRVRSDGGQRQENSAKESRNEGAGRRRQLGPTSIRACPPACYCTLCSGCPLTLGFAFHPLQTLVVVRNSFMCASAILPVTIGSSPVTSV